MLYRFSLILIVSADLFLWSVTRIDCDDQIVKWKYNIIEIPIDKSELDSSALKDWETAKYDVTNALGVKQNPAMQLLEDEAMTCEEIAVEETQLA